METTFVNSPAFRFALCFMALIYLFTLPVSPYMGQFVVKVLPMLMILAIAMTQLKGKLRWLMSSGVIASCFGDVFLALPIEDSFIFGLGAFLIAQLIYAITYFNEFNVKQVAQWRKLSALVIVIFALLMADYLLPDTGDMKIPVAIYLTVVCAMGIAALVSGYSAIVAIGALSFIVSDSILALSYFKTPLPFSDVLVMATYYLAQFLMVQGVVNFQKQSHSI